MSELYEQRGVSSQKEDVHEAIRHLDKGLYPNAFCKILPDYLSMDDAYACIMHADTAGTKSILAYLYWKETGDLSVWKGIAQDALVMNIDDMICSGATSHFIVSSTIARNKKLIPKEVLAAVINGCDELIQEWRALGIDLHLAGGETADVGDLVKTIDVGYTAFTRMERKNVISIHPRAGDVIVGFASFGQCQYEKEYNSGIGCNGLTSARHDILNKYYREHFPESFDSLVPEEICYSGNYRMTDKAENNIAIGKLLLSPTRTFAPLVKNIIDQHRDQIHGIVHNTGGGQTKCMKYIDGPLRIVKDQLFDIPLIFQLIQESSKTPFREMYQVFNMGSRLEIYTSPDIAPALIDKASQWGIEARVVGRVEEAEKKELLIRGPYGEFSY
ncbi:MAG TPA: AIR synthase-related protein [Chitinophagaceae bacterium]|nr:AIR synthase-related protein [Chitinophagaceae bacterium]HNF70969.1 AIR synthase-related protein [Chitinophagaceae bacterium]